jgi:hypothetical protein
MTRWMASSCMYGDRKDKSCRHRGRHRHAADMECL